MSYAIGNVIYGVVADDALIDALNEFIPEEEDRERAGFNTPYQSSGPSRCYFGIDIDQIDEIDDVDLTELFSKCDKTSLNDLKRRYAEKMKDFPQELKILLSNPKLLIVWSSS